MTNPPSFDLHERTAAFGEAVIEFCIGIPGTPVNTPLTSQLVRSATSIGANYYEADDAESKKDFRHKIAICRKEASETKYWLRMIGKAVPRQIQVSRKLWSEANELHLIFVSIIRTTDKNLRAQKAPPSPNIPKD